MRDPTVDDSYMTLPPCFHCKHVTQNGGQNPDGYKCKAFPDGVPATITLRYDRHDKVDVFFGDTIVYEPTQEYDADGPYYYSYEGMEIRGMVP
jgi:hypothetical protein